MKATTIKLEGDLLRELEKAKPESVTLSAYVREVLRGDLRRRSLTKAAALYQEFLESNPEEVVWLREWEEADLASAPKSKRRRK
jgi:hypothetical protein